MSAIPVPREFVPQAFSPGLIEVVELLRLIAGDPLSTDRALYYEQGIVTDAAVRQISRTVSQSEVFSVLTVAFAGSSGAGRYQVTGAFPTAAGVGMPILAGGYVLTIRGNDNINNFRMIAETGETMEFNALLFKAQRWLQAPA